MMFSLYDLETGLFTGARLGGDSLEWVTQQTPAGCGAWPGAHDKGRWRVNVELGELERYDPPPPPPPTAEMLGAQARVERDALMAATDWSQGRDVPEALALKWQPYRQALRDITAQPGFPYDITWPTPPGDTP